MNTHRLSLIIGSATAGVIAAAGVFSNDPQYGPYALAVMAIGGVVHAATTDNPAIAAVIATPTPTTQQLQAARMAELETAVNAAVAALAAYKAATAASG